MSTIIKKLYPNLKYLDQESLIVDYQFGKLIKDKYFIMNLVQVYNEAPNLKKYFESALRLADGIIILDDGSKDNTWTHIDDFDYTLKIKIRRDTDKFNDLRNRNLLLAVLQNIFLDNKISIDWVIWLDCDEIIGNTDKELLAIKEQLRKEENEILNIAFYHMWNEYQYNGEYPYSSRGVVHHQRLFKNNPQKRPYRIISNVALHFTLEPYETKKKGNIPIKIKHYGMSTKEKRTAKYLNYTTKYDLTKIQQSYEHIIKEKPRLYTFR